MKRRSIFWIVVPLVLLFLGLLGRSTLIKAKQQQRTAEGYQVFAKILKDRREAPELSLKLLGGGPADLREFRGRVVMLNFRTTW
ncbi:MAG: hypothetical protein HYY65_14160 [Candidatus Tectomicrobia bacterium]|uniref:Alkyl hydroperoxide reductase subunit C/ Thiol specific antioxidant domain-containing protein n=1 Tax=Tectimicrobiota bacterium TaxID=2528274 RepID=A0A932GSK7_UNCTE|nr:hypothetical protein [Candidatus Tectomicrobia bacterium]